MKTKKKKNLARRTALSSNQSLQPKLPFIEHVYELRRRIFYILISVVLWGIAIYAVQQHVVALLLKPAGKQHFIYTSVGGGIDFLFRVCVYGGIVLSLPVIVFQALRFFEPLLDNSSQRFVYLGSLISGLLAIIGVAFGYFIGLPAALHFLLHQFTTLQIQPLLTIQSYLHFVIVYMAGSAMIFQLPLLLIFVNRIKPLKPKRLFHYERWVILVAFVLAGLMNPTPNILSQLLVAGPFILMYQISIAIIAFINRPRYPAHIQKLVEEDSALFAQRQELSALKLKPQLPTRLPVEQVIEPRPVRRPYLITDIRPATRRNYTRHQVAQTAIKRQTTRQAGADRRFIDFITPESAISSSA